MDYEIEEQYSVFLKDIGTGLLSHKLYLREDEYEDEYSHNEIDDAQIKLSKRIKECLHNNFPNQYCVFIDWCVRVMSVELASKREILNYEKHIVG